MSFILDALKKSETERQRNAGPVLAEVPRSHRAPARPWWVFALGALLLVNLIVFAVVLLRGQHTENKTAPATPSSTTVAPAPVAAAPTSPPAPAVAAASMAPPPAALPRSEASLADEAAISAPTAAEQANMDASLAGASVVPGGPPIVRSLNQNQGNQNPGNQNPGSQNYSNQNSGNQAAASSDERLPSVNELTGAAAMHLPDLRMDLHVFANNPQNRFVSINGHKYVEGQKLSEGPTLERITRDGVVLNNQGMRFVLPRPQ